MRRAGIGEGKARAARRTAPDGQTIIEADAALNGIEVVFARKAGSLIPGRGTGTEPQGWFSPQQRRGTGQSDSWLSATVSVRWIHWLALS
jgi:hypothetical protein